MSVIIVSNIVPHDGQAEAVLERIKAAIPIIQTQEGCEIYAVNKGRGKARGRLCLLEKWVDEEALAHYGESPELIQLHDDLEPLIESLEDYMVFAPIPVGDPVKGAI